mmetsp:Transcript_14495/g.31471  ORF Transcript_14495/g.31471 Transcript_14495/m.31471 type:complete len:206 (+) Transcript_14495:35-652(+)
MAMSALVRGYLTLYNVVQWFIWLYIGVNLAVLFSTGASASKMWDHVGSLGHMACNVAVLELLHALLGWVRSSPLTVLMQLFARLPVVNMAAFTPELHHHFGIMFTFTCYATIEVVRYLFYAWNLWTEEPPKMLTWLRYSIFVFDYPAGCLSEMSVWWQAMTIYANNTPLLMLSRVAFCLYPPGMSWLWMQVWAQRRKKLGHKKSA